LAWSPDSTHLLSDEDGNTGAVQIWESLTGKTVSRLQIQDPDRGLSRVESAAFSPDGKFIALALTTIEGWDVQSGKQVLDYRKHVSNGGNYPRSLAWSPDGTMIVSSSGGETGPATVNVWKPV
jgi:WD40 repeat protein